MADNKQHHGSSGSFSDKERAREAGRKGGEHSHSGQHSQSGGDHRQQGGGKDNPGNFANDRERASEAGRKGGEK